MCLGCHKQKAKAEHGNDYLRIQLQCLVNGHKFLGEPENLQFSGGFPNQAFRICAQCGMIEGIVEHD